MGITVLSPSPTDALYTCTDPAVRIEYEQREKAWRDNISRLHDAVSEERGKWQDVVAEKDAALANKDAALANKAAENERLRAQIADLQAQTSAFK
ncbi:MAG: hypothetical protein FWB99_08375 [Treponema sp.]|nr:hypothetical protein [Treponema sp.]